MFNPHNDVIAATRYKVKITKNIMKLVKNIPLDLRNFIQTQENAGSSMKLKQAKVTADSTISINPFHGRYPSNLALYSFQKIPSFSDRGVG